MNLTELKKLAEEASHDNEDAMIELQFQSETTLQMIEVMEQMGEALESIHDYPHKTDHIIDWCGEALAAYNKLKGE